MSLTQAQKDRLREADEIIQANRTTSQQPRFSPGATPGMVFNLTARWAKEVLESAPVYASDSRTRDEWLTKFWSNEPYLSGVINSVTQIDRNRGWSLVGGRNQVIRFSNVLHNWQVNPGKVGWRDGCGVASLSFWTTDIGALVEVGRQFEGGAMAGLFHLDPTRCKLTDDPDAPIVYNPTPSGQIGKMSVPFLPSDVIRVNSMTNISERFNGLGYCALSRAMELALIMTAVWRHEQEMLFARAPKGLLLLRGVTEEGWKKAMDANNADLDALEREWFGNVAVFASGGDIDIDAKMFMLSNLPENYDQEKFSNLMMFGYSLCFGYDAREFWPVSGGALGSGRETEVQHRKATDKGGREFWFGLQEQLQGNLPETLRFEADERDAEGELVDANLNKAKADALVALKSALPGLTPAQLYELAADQGLIPYEWVDTAPDEEEAAATDTGDEDNDTNPEGDANATDEDATPEGETSTQFRKRVLEFVEVQQAISQFPDEPIVRYHWPDGKLQTLYASGRDATPRVYQLDKTMASSRQKRFGTDAPSIPLVMAKLAEEVQRDNPVKLPGIDNFISPVMQEEQKEGWLRAEFRRLREAIQGHKAEPVQVTINNPPSPGVQVHNYLDGKPVLDPLEEQKKRQELVDDLTQIMQGNQATLTAQLTEYLKANQKELTQEVLDDLTKTQQTLAGDVLTKLQKDLAEKERITALQKKNETQSVVERLRRLTNGK